MTWRRERSAAAFIVAAIATLLFCSGAATPRAQATKSVWDGVYTNEQAQRGEGTYATRCAGCHGTDLNGQDAPGLAGGGFSSNWNGLTLRDLFERILKTMPMDDPGALTRQQTSDVLSFILSKNNFPAGTVELPADAAPLGAIVFELTKKP